MINVFDDFLSTEQECVLEERNIGKHQIKGEGYMGTVQGLWNRPLRRLLTNCYAL